MSEDGRSSNNKPDVSIGRRGFLKGAGAASAALGASVAAPRKLKHNQPSAAQPPNIAARARRPVKDIPILNNN
jgi:hypothetical protein